MTDDRREQPSSNDAVFRDETLMAFADGALGHEEAARIADAVSRDPALAARVESFKMTRTLTKRAFGDVEVPQRLSERISALTAAAAQTEAKIVAPDAARPPRREIARRSADRGRWRIVARANAFALAAAASVALVVGFGGGYLTGSISGPSEASPQLESFAATQDIGPIAAALNAVASGPRTSLGENGSLFRGVASFRSQDGRFCREFEIDRRSGETTVGVACAEAGGGAWRLQFLVEAPATGDGFAPASSLASLEAYLTAIDAGPALTAEQEAAALNERRSGD